MIINRSAQSISRELQHCRTKAVAVVNKAIGDTRLRFITDIPGQQMVYSDKEKEAREYLAEASPPADLWAYPFIEQEVIATGMTAFEAAQLFLNMAALWRPVGAQLEGLRIGYNDQIGKAASKPVIEQLLADLNATLEAYANG